MHINMVFINQTNCINFHIWSGFWLSTWEIWCWSRIIESYQRIAMLYKQTIGIIYTIITIINTTFIIWKIYFLIICVCQNIQKLTTTHQKNK